MNTSGNEWDRGDIRGGNIPIDSDKYIKANIYILK